MYPGWYWCRLTVWTLMISVYSDEQSEKQKLFLLTYTTFPFLELYNSNATVDYRLLQNILKLSLYETFVSVRVGGIKMLVTVSSYSAVASHPCSSSEYTTNASRPEYRTANQASFSQFHCTTCWLLHWLYIINNHL